MSSYIGIGQYAFCHIETALSFTIAFQLKAELCGWTMCLSTASPRMMRSWMRPPRSFGRRDALPRRPHPRRRRRRMIYPSHSKVRKREVCSRMVLIFYGTLIEGFTNFMHTILTKVVPNKLKVCPRFVQCSNN